jgi:D-arabinose 5-phosphate isomerase GutQ
MGETITPSIQKGDTWVAISGSGTTKGIVSDTKTALVVPDPEIATQVSPF